MRCTGVILAGGEAKRFGGVAKGLERVGGRRLIDRVADALAPVTDALLVVANADEAHEWLPGVRVARDIRRGEGALGGLHAALMHAASPILVVAWDMPFVPSSLLAALRVLGEAGHDAAVPVSAARHGVEPACAWYDVTSLPAIERRLDAGERRMTSFLDDVRVATLSPDEVARYGAPDVIFQNVNTAEELARAERDATRPGFSHLPTSHA